MQKLIRANEDLDRIEFTFHGSDEMDETSGRGWECVAVCPVDCIPLDPANLETKEELLKKYHYLVAEK